MAARALEGRTLRFLANVDPIDVARALNGLNPEETMVIVVSKTFTTAETMLNARTVRKWLIAQLGKRSHKPCVILELSLSTLDTPLPALSNYTCCMDSG